MATESVVALGAGQSVDDSQEVDRDEDVSVPADETMNGTLRFDDIGSVFHPGDSLGLGVGLLDADEQLIGQMPIAETADTGSLTLTAVDTPAEIAVDESLEVTYTIENSGKRRGECEPVRRRQPGGLSQQRNRRGRREQEQHTRVRVGRGDSRDG